MDLRFENLLFDCSLERPERNIESSEKSKFPGMEQVKDALDQAYPNRVEYSNSMFIIADDNGDKHKIDTRFRDGALAFTNASKGSEIAIAIKRQKQDDVYTVMRITNPNPNPNPDKGEDYGITKEKAGKDIWENLSESDAVQKIVDIMKAQVGG